jgi:beta-lactamase regulating signal transducer with metallopeptidase domain/major membrane immunogen (membrane-anchored lipoprotein)
MLSLFDAIGASANTTTWLTILVDASWKGVVLLLTALLLSLLLRRAAAATRHLVWSLALIGLLALPLLSFILPTWNVPIVPQVVPSAPRLERSITPIPEYRLPKSPSQKMLVSNGKTWTVSTSYSSQPATVRRQSNWLTALSSWTLPTWAFLIWLNGAVIVSARWLLGWLSVKMLSRRSHEILDDDWNDLSENICAALNLKQPVKLQRAEVSAVPMTWGLLNPVVLLPDEADEWPEERRRVVLMHELAHVKRGDLFAQIVAQITCALYWFNPLAWMAARRLRVEREQACDDAVLNAGTKASEYANHILEILRALRPAKCSPSAAVAMAQCSQIEGRLRAILNPNLRRGAMRPIGEILMGAAVACVVLPLAAISPWARFEKKPAATNVKLAMPNMRFQPIDPKINLRLSVSTDPMVIAPWNESSDATPEPRIVSGDCNEEKAKQNLIEKYQLDQLVQNGAAVAGQSVVEAIRALGIENVPGEHLVGQASEELGKYLAEKLREWGYDKRTAEEYARRVSDGFDETYVQDVKKAGYPNLTIEQLLQMRIHGVDADYINAMKDAGSKDLTVEELIQLRIHGVDGDYAKEMKAAGFADLTIEQLLQMRIQGVDADYAKEMKANYGDLSLEELLQLRIQGVDADYAREMKAAGFGDLTIDQLLQTRIQGVDADYAKEMKATYGDLSINELLQLRIQGVDTEYAREMKAAGFDDLSIEQLLQLKIQGVDADYAKEMKAAYGDLSINELLQLRIQGVDTDYAKEMKAAGFGDLSIDELLQLRIQGVDAEYAKEMKAAGFADLSTNTLLQLRIQGVDAEYVKEMKAVGYNNLTTEQLLQMRIQGVDADFVKELQEAGLKNLSPEKVIRMKIHGFDASFFKE